jgi:hypothetical protein
VIISEALSREKGKGREMRRTVSTSPQCLVNLGVDDYRFEASKKGRAKKIFMPQSLHLTREKPFHAR